jgi:hypothetical protein
MPRIKTRILLGLLALTLLAALSSGQKSPPDLILLNGKIFTSDSAHPFTSLAAVKIEPTLLAAVLKSVLTA